MDATLLPKRFANVTPSDTAELGSCIGLFVGVGGDVVATGLDGISATFKAQDDPTNTSRFVRVLNTGKTATNIVALFAS